MFSAILAFALSLPVASAQTEARTLTLQKHYDESIALLTKYQPNREEYNEYCYLMAVNYFALNDKENAEKWIKILRNSFLPLQRRHEAMLNIMEYDIQSWKADDLGDITRDMKVVESRLEIAQGGQTTQKVQKQIVDKLDKLIKEMENKANGNGSGNGQDKDQNANKQGPGQNQPNQPAQDSVVMGGAGKGAVDEKKLRQVAEQWGSLPPEKRSKIIEEITRETPQKYKPLIDEYFKSLNRIHKP